jgi:hypothetical protein
MNRIDLWELLKNTADSNVRSRLKAAKIISFGVVQDVIDAQTVRVVESVKTGISDNIYTVTLLSLSSTLFESAVLPQPGDLVLLLFLQKYDSGMFELHRDVQDAVIKNRSPRGYNAFSGVGILLSPLKGASTTKLLYSGDAVSPDLSMTTAAVISARFERAAAAVFDSIDENDAPVELLFGRHSPFTLEHWAAVRHRHGFAVSPVDNELMETDAPVTKQYSRYAPITRDIQGAQTTGVGLGADKAGNPVETDAPVTETIHGKAPVTRNIRSPQTITIGIGNDESGSADEQREAPVAITMGEKANVTVASKSGMTAHFDKDIVLESDTGLIQLGNSVATLGGMIADLLTALANLTTEGSPAAHTAKTWATANIEPLKLKWNKVFN